MLDKIRNSFPWLELLWADSGYNAHQVDAAVAKVPSLRVEIVKRSDDMVDSDAKCNTLGRSGSPRKDRIFLPFPPPSAAFRDAKAAPRKGKIE